MASKVLVTGAAGYIGSVVTEYLIDRDVPVIAIDDLSQGHHQAVDPRAEFIKADYGDARVMGDSLGWHDGLPRQELAPAFRSAWNARKTKPTAC